MVLATLGYALGFWKRGGGVGGGGGWGEDALEFVGHSEFNENSPEIVQKGM